MLISGLLQERTPLGGLVRDFQGRTLAWIGHLPDAATPGDYLRGRGELTREHTLAVQGVQLLARGADLTAAFLTHFVKGVGPVTAGRLAGTLGPDALTRLANGQIPDEVPERLHLPLRDACRSDAREQVAALYLLGLHPTHCLTLVKAWGTAAAARFADAPFEATTLGIPFATLDAAHTLLGGTLDDPRRQAALAFEIVRSGSVQQGHIRLPAAQVRFMLRDLHALSVEEAQQATQNNPHLQAYSGHLYLPHLHEQEQALARRLITLLQARATRAVVPLIQREALSREQFGAVSLAAATPLMVLTGGPGTGKSTTVRTIADRFALSGLRFALAAPTGKASSRLSDATGREALTLHRLLGAGRKGFTHHERNPLMLDALIVDECSMIDEELMLALLQAVHPGTRLVLVGDPNQLPPIGPGMPLVALIDTLPVAHLTTVYRQAAGSPVVQLAYSILDNEPIDWEGVGLPFSQTPDARTAVRLAMEQDAQLLAPTRKGPLGVQALNAAARELRGKRDGLPVTDGVVSEGDPVVCTRNLYDLGVMNGMTGVVREVHAQEGGIVRAEFEGELVTFRGTGRAALMPAYAMTVHRSQGSEWENVAVVLHGSHGVMLTRTLAYTGVTRAKKGLHLLGEQDAWQQAILHQAPDRHCGLEARLHE